MSADGRISGLTTRGRCLLAGGVATAACSVLLNERDLLRVGTFVAALPLLALLLAARTRRTVRARRDLSHARAPVGSEVAVELRLTGAALIGSVRLVDTVPDAAGPQAAAPPRFTVHRLSGRGRITEDAPRGSTARSADAPRGSNARSADAPRGALLGYPLRPLLRGVHAIGPLTAGATDPLGLAEFEREVAGPTRLLVVPRVVALRGLPPAVGTGDGTPGAALAHQGQGRSDVLTRPYRHGDELRRVHWRSTARYDELMVRLEERPWRGGTTVLLDRRDAAHRGRGAEASLEFAVSLTASVCAHLIGRGEPVSLVTEDGAALTTPGGAGLDPLLDALAALRPSARADLGGPEIARSTDVLAVLGAIGPGDVEALVGRRTIGGHAVLLDVATWDPATGGAASTAGAAGAADALRRAGWHVTVATAGSAPDRVWDALVAGAAPDGIRAGTS